jgi:hypothetical protein
MLHLLQHRSSGRIGVGEGHLEVDGGTDQALLGPVVQVALDPAPLRIGSRDHPTLRGLDLRQPPPCHRTGNSYQGLSTIATFDFVSEPTGREA